MVYTAGMGSLSEQSFLILTALADRPCHGYALVAEVSAISEGRIELRASTLYAALERLTDRGLVEPDHDEVENGRLRRYYRLTDEGAAEVQTEAQRMAAQARAAKRRLARRAQGSGARLGTVG